MTEPKLECGSSCLLTNKTEIESLILNLGGSRAPTKLDEMYKDNAYNNDNINQSLAQESDHSFIISFNQTLEISFL